MSLVQKISPNKLPVYHFKKLNYHTNTPYTDTRSATQLKQTIDYFTSNAPDIKEYAEKLKILPLKHMRIATDLLELSNKYLFFHPTINMKKKIGEKSIRENLVTDVITASKENPEALDLISSIIANTDTITSKYALYCMRDGFITNNKIAPQVEEISKHISQIHRINCCNYSLLNRYSRQIKFMTILNILISPHNKPENINLLYTKILPFVSTRTEDFIIKIPDFLKADTTYKKVAEKIDQLPKYLETTSHKNPFDIVSYITSNTPTTK